MTSPHRHPIEMVTVRILSNLSSLPLFLFIQTFPTFSSSLPFSRQYLDDFGDFQVFYPWSDSCSTSESMWVLSRPFLLLVNAGVPQVLILATTLFFITNELLSGTPNQFNFADEVTLHCSLSYRTLRYANTNVDRDRNFVCGLLNSDTEHLLRLP